MRHPLCRSFRVRPDPSRAEFYKVHVFRDRETMHRFWQEQVGTGRLPKEARRFGSSEFEAQVNSWSVFSLRLDGGLGERTPECGQILFYFAATGVGIVAHEMTHAALYYCLRRGRQFHRRGNRRFGAHDEALARSCGELTKQFYAHYWRLFPRGRYR